MKVVGYAVVTLASALSLLVAPATGQMTLEQRQADLQQRIRACTHLSRSENSPPVPASRPLELSSLGVSIEIPENYRAMARSSEAVSVLTPESYEYSQCMIENRVPSSVDVYSVGLYISEPVSEAMLYEEMAANRRFGVKRVLGTQEVGGREALVYIHEGMYTMLVVRINYPDRDASLVISTDVSDDELPMQETFERVLTSLRFL